ncbi:MAG: HAD hydrolase-like protein [Desulfobulbus sp.]|jgi:phosphoglycolate phosphatase-like HAD superfamily hydrolase|nr:HAD hydrolase-like protein [Desulfobulbus sp.]
MTQIKKNWQAVLFDFDGVIAASHEVKSAAFATLFAAYGPAVQEAVVRYHVENGGVPRHEKLRHCCEQIAGVAVDKAGLARLSEQFAALVYDGVLEAPLLPGVDQTLKELCDAQVPTFVVSGTPAEEMRRVTDAKGLAPFFLEVHGSPRPKAEIIRDILGRHQFSPDGCLFIGDALADYRAARDTGLAFLGIVPEGATSVFPAGTACSATVHLPS